MLEGKPLRSLTARDLARKMSLVLTYRVAVGMMPVTSFVALGRHPYTNWTGRLRKVDQKSSTGPWRTWVIESLADKPMSELSDGERQKVKIAVPLLRSHKSLSSTKRRPSSTFPAVWN
jgi:iron complex transport system ATP-binding protein